VGAVLTPLVTDDLAHTLHARHFPAAMPAGGQLPACRAGRAVSIYAKRPYMD